MTYHFRRNDSLRSRRIDQALVQQMHKASEISTTAARGLRILVVTDAWRPQLNGVVRTLERMNQELTAMGHEVHFITPLAFRTVPLPMYKEIRLAFATPQRVGREILSFSPDAIHIATEGPLGFAARSFCMQNGLPFSTAFHTKLPEYVNARTRLPVDWGYELERRFHEPASATMCPTPSIREELERRGIGNTRLWSRGVDLELFDIKPDTVFSGLPRPIWLSVGRVATEKNLEAFLGLELPGTKVVVGDGPQLGILKAKYKDVVFCGRKTGEDLARHYSSADVFVFPSRTDTFGLVNLEALACGTPIAAYPVAGPRDIVSDGSVGVLHEELRIACLMALGCATPEACRAYAERFSWRESAEQFLTNLVIRRPISHRRARAA